MAVPEYGAVAPSELVVTGSEAPEFQLARASSTRMRRTTSQDIREGTEDLKEAAEQSLNVILDLSLDGVVRWVSPSWADVVGTAPDSMQGKPVADVLLENPNAFADAVEVLRKDASRSQIVRFDVPMGPLSKLSPPLPGDQSTADNANDHHDHGDGNGNGNDNGNDHAHDHDYNHDNDNDNSGRAVERQDHPVESARRLVLEGQGVMVYDRSTGAESHVRGFPFCRRGGEKGVCRG